MNLVILAFVIALIVSHSDETPYTRVLVTFKPEDTSIRALNSPMPGGIVSFEDTDGGTITLTASSLISFYDTSVIHCIGSAPDQELTIQRLVEDCNWIGWITVRNKHIRNSIFTAHDFQLHCSRTALRTTTEFPYLLVWIEEYLVRYFDDLQMAEISSSASQDDCIPHDSCELCTGDASCGWCNLTSPINLTGTEYQRVCIDQSTVSNYNCTIFVTLGSACAAVGSSSSESEPETITIAELNFSMSSLFFALLALIVVAFSFCSIFLCILLRSKLEILRPISSRMEFAASYTMQMGAEREFGARIPFKRL